MIARSPRLCFFAHYDPDDLVADHVLFYLAALREAGFVTVVASTSKLDAAQRARIGAWCAELVLRDNVGLDFGGWQDLYARHAPLGCDLLLLANDSVYGPLVDLGDFIDRLIATPADLYGIVGSLQGRAHAQSWFVLLRPSAYRAPAFVRLMIERAPSNWDKKAIIDRYEIGLTADLAAAGLAVHLSYDPATHGLLSHRHPFNGAHLLWEELIVTGVSPFLKIELLRDNPLEVEDIDRWPAVVGARRVELVPMIAADLRRRVRRIAVLRSSDRWRRFLSAPPTAWPRLRILLRRDHALTRSSRNASLRANAGAFAVAALTARVLRAPINLLRAKGGVDHA